MPRRQASKPTPSSSEFVYFVAYHCEFEQRPVFGHPGSHRHEEHSGSVIMKLDRPIADNDSLLNVQSHLIQQVTEQYPGDTIASFTITGLNRL